MRNNASPGLTASGLKVEVRNAFSASICLPDVLNLGCGRKRMDRAINLDRTAETQPDVVHDLNQTPWPFPDNAFQAVYASDVIEHLHDVVPVMEEIHRISCNGALIHITVPHFSCSNAFTDPTHRHHFGYSSFDYFTENNDLCFYSSARFRLRTARLVFYPTTLSKIVWRLANRFPAAY